MIAKRDADNSKIAGKILVFPYPPSENEFRMPVCYNCIRRRKSNVRIVETPKAREYKARVSKIAEEKGYKPIPRAREVKVTIRIYRPLRSGDLLNREKVLSDALHKILFEDDAQIVEAHLYRHEDANFPRAEVTVEEA